ncbi:TetR/AcrR family transcriptional regulator [Saccharothrix violaceirubra]|uniref:AcrR family transcriptional regulator n=1 Tax=Saccharothrix violaceirubra TaxID=413306 RepID=A0A7W7SZT2_9PSEU|nr:TetR/AcrR family transcriptional regulator [Saccharothrix violaceirubra]MBB4963996.1 AcrR family transcriptional regulator [Saccharothrix violaceirubra]
MAARPGGRSERVRASVIDATFAELVERGYLGMSVENVANRAGVHKTTVYRRWGTVEGLVADALDHTRDTPWPVPDTGTLVGDLTAIAYEVVDSFADPVRRTVPVAVVAAALMSSAATRAKNDFYGARTAEAAQVVTRAVERGELPATTDAAEVIRLVCGPLYHRVFITGDPIDHGVADRVVRVVVHAAKAGLV